MKNNAIHILLVTAFYLALPTLAAAQKAPIEPMQGVPPSRESQVTMGNYRDQPMSRWAFRNAGAPLNVVTIPGWPITICGGYWMISWVSTAPWESTVR